MQLQDETDDLGFCLSFNCYFSDSLIASAAAKVICELQHEQQTAQLYELSDVDEDDFEFSPEHSDEVASVNKQIDDLEHRKLIIPVSDAGAVEKSDDASPVSLPLHKSSDDECENLSSFSSSESNEHEFKRSGIFCLWRSKAAVVPSTIAECTKSSGSTGSGSIGSRRWKIWNLIRRGNSKKEVSLLFRQSKKIGAGNEKDQVKNEEVGKVAGKVKTTSFHELFYVKKRAEQKGDKRKSFLPYKQDLLGLFVNINRSGNNKLPF